MVPFDSGSATNSTGQIAATVTTAERAEVALIDSATGQVTRTIETLPNTDAQATGAFDGRYTVWKESLQPGNTDRFTVKEWDSMGAVRTVGGSHTLHGQTMPSTWEDPVIAGDYSAWVEGLDDNGGGEIVLLNLTTGARSIVRTGHPGWLTLTRSLLVWAESNQPGKSTTLRALNLKTRTATSLPTPLRDVQGAWGFATDGTFWVWIAGSQPTLYEGREAGPTVKLGAIPKGGGSPPVATTAGMATVPVSAGGLMIANLDTHAWTYEPDASWAAATDGHLLVTKEAVKGGPEQTPIAPLTATSVTRCHATANHTGSASQRVRPVSGLRRCARTRRRARLQGQNRHGVLTSGREVVTRRTCVAFADFFAQEVSRPLGLTSRRGVPQAVAASLTWTRSG